MSEATKTKMKKWLPAAVVDKLEAGGILYPLQIKQATDEELGDANLTAEEISAVRVVFPEVARG